MKTKTKSFQKFSRSTVCRLGHGYGELVVQPPLHPLSLTSTGVVFFVIMYV